MQPLYSSVFIWHPGPASHRLSPICRPPSRQRGVSETTVAPSCRNWGIEGQKKGNISILPWHMVRAQQEWTPAGSWRALTAWWCWICTPVWISDRSQSTRPEMCVCIHMYTQTYTHITAYLSWPQATRQINSKMSTEYTQVLSIWKWLCLHKLWICSAYSQRWPRCICIPQTGYPLCMLIGLGLLRKHNIVLNLHLCLI